MRGYNGVLLVDPELDEDGVSKIEKVIGEVIKGADGEVGNWERWGRRRLAYKIKGKGEGSYVLLTFKGGDKTLNELKRTCGLTENILRCMFLKDGKAKNQPRGHRSAL